jgi:hypothetical protein
MPTMVSARLAIAWTSNALAGLTAAARVVSSVATPAAESANPRQSMKSPKRITMPYSAQTAMPSGIERSRAKMAAVNASARAKSRRARASAFGFSWELFGIDTELLIHNSVKRTLFVRFGGLFRIPS